MAKALLGYVAPASDALVAMEVEGLRRRVRQLSTELSGTRAELDRCRGELDRCRAELTTLREHDEEMATISLPDSDLARLTDLSHAGR